VRNLLQNIFFYRRGLMARLNKPVVAVLASLLPAAINETMKLYFLRYITSHYALYRPFYRITKILL
jgi:hypothetical protein